MAALIASAFTGNGNGVSDLVAGRRHDAWLALGSLYLVGFWSLAGQTLGMRFVGIRLDVEGRGLRLGRSVRRLIGMVLAAIPFGLGFLGIFFDERRRAWDDRLSGVDVRLRGQRAQARTLVAPRRLEAGRGRGPVNDEGPGIPGPSLAACCWIVA